MIIVRGLIVSPITVLLGLVFCTLGLAQDRVHVKQGSPVQGTINKLSPIEVSITVRGKEQTLPMKDVRKISFDKEPAGMDRARDLALDGKYQQALEQLRSLPRESLTENSQLRQDYEFYFWFCEGTRSLAGTGDQTAAIKGLVNLDKANPNSHHRFAIKRLLGRLALAKNAYDKANEYFTDLGQSPDDIQKAYALYYLAKVQLEQGKPDEARNQIRGLMATSVTSPEIGRVKTLGSVLEARCEIESGNIQPALEALDALAQREDNTDLQLFAEINNARGAAYLKLNDPQRAAYSYLQTDLLFFTDPETHAEALYHLKSLMVNLGQPAKAADAGERLTRLYASNVWASKP